MTNKKINTSELVYCTRRRPAPSHQTTSMLLIIPISVLGLTAAPTQILCLSSEHGPLLSVPDSVCRQCRAVHFSHGLVITYNLWLIITNYSYLLVVHQITKPVLPQQLRAEVTPAVFHLCLTLFSRLIRSTKQGQRKQNIKAITLNANGRNWSCISSPRPVSIQSDKSLNFSFILQSSWYLYGSSWSV